MSVVSVHQVSPSLSSHTTTILCLQRTLETPRFLNTACNLSSFSPNHAWYVLRSLILTNKEMLQNHFTSRTNRNDVNRTLLTHLCVNSINHNPLKILFKGLTSIPSRERSNETLLTLWKYIYWQRIISCVYNKWYINTCNVFFVYKSVTIFIINRF